MKNQKPTRGGALINCAKEEFVMISSTTCLSSNDVVIVDKTEQNMSLLDAISKSDLDLLISDKLTIKRKDPFDGFRVKLADRNVDYFYGISDPFEFETEAPRKTVAGFKGGYSSINGDFIVSCSNHKRRCCYFGGVLDKDTNSLIMQNFHTVVAKPLHNVIVALPELNPVMIATNKDVSIEISVTPDMIKNHNTGDRIVVRVELTTTPSRIGMMRVIAAA